MSTSVCLLSTLALAARYFVVLLFDCNGAFNAEYAGANVDLFVYLVGCGALVAATNLVNLVKFIRNLFVEGREKSERTTIVLRGSGAGRAVSHAGKRAPAV